MIDLMSSLIDTTLTVLGMASVIAVGILTVFMQSSASVPQEDHAATMTEVCRKAA